MKIGLLGSAHKSHVARWAAWLDGRGHEVVLFSDTAAPGNCVLGDVRVIRPEWTLWRNIRAFKLGGGPFANNRHKWRAYREAILAEKPDLLHAQEALAYGPMLAHFPGFPRVLTPWGPDMERLAEGGEAAALVRQGLEAADMVATNAPGLEEHWARLSGLPRERFQLFSWGVNTTCFRPRPEAERRAVRGELGLPPGAPLVLSPRLAKRNYRIEKIVEGWVRARREAAEGSRLREGRLVVLRGGADEAPWKALSSQARELDGASIRLVDKYLDSRKMAALYSAASATVMLPETDLLALSLLEAAGCGSLPLLNEQRCYRSAFGDLVEEDFEKGKALFTGRPDAEGVAELLGEWNELSSEALGAAARRNAAHVAAHHDWERCAPRMEDVYRRAVQRFSSKASEKNGPWR